MTIHGNWGYSTILDLCVGQRQTPGVYHKTDSFICSFTVIIYVYTYSMIIRETIVIRSFVPMVDSSY